MCIDTYIPHEAAQLQDSESSSTQRAPVKHRVRVNYNELFKMYCEWEE